MLCCRSLLPSHGRYSRGTIQHVEKDLVAQYKAAAKKQQIEEGEEVIPEQYAPAQVIFPDGAVYKGEIQLGLLTGVGKERKNCFSAAADVKGSTSSSRPCPVPSRPLNVCRLIDWC